MDFCMVKRHKKRWSKYPEIELIELVLLVLVHHSVSIQKRGFRDFNIAGICLLSQLKFQKMSGGQLLVVLVDSL
jgi:hypothetical protein